MLYRVQVNVAKAGNVPAWSFMRPSGGQPYSFASHDEARRMAAICYPAEHSHAARVVLEIERRDVGTWQEGIGLVQARDIGKRGYMQRGGLAWENDEQRNGRRGE